MIELTGPDVRNEHTPDVAPAVRARIKLDDFTWFHRVGVIVKQQSHGPRGSTEDDKLDAAIMDQCPVR
jgi:hypothetical protein